MKYFSFLFLLFSIFLYGNSSIILELSQPKLMQSLEKQGLSFSELIEAKGLKGLNNQELFKHPFYKSLVKSLLADLNQRKRQDLHLGVTMKSSHRLFDGRWLRSAFASFELVGVINRTDRLSFQPDKCGEVRLIYRLAYRKQKDQQVVYSRLPLTVNVVFWQQQGIYGCRYQAKQWDVKPQLKELLAGPLSAGVVRAENLKSVEFNLQALRWPSTIRPDMGGYAEYFLRVFHRGKQSYELATLENTPNIALLKRRPELKKELRGWIADNLKKLDYGVALLPEKFLATKTSSFALHGMARKSNRLYDQLFKEQDFATLDFKNLKRIKSPQGLLRRLNDLSCVGCHQGRTVAGFHFLGKDRQSTDAVNAIAVSSSPHFIRDQGRRKAFLQALMAGRTPEHERPFAERSDDPAEGDFGSHCGFKDKSFQHWSCHTGLHCREVYQGQAIGECSPLIATAGAACEVGTVTQTNDPLKDRIQQKKQWDCGKMFSVCEASAVGFPNGMCSRSCSLLAQRETCGRIALLSGFNDCLARGKNFSDCLTNNVRPAAMRACNREHPCRDDMVCVRHHEDNQKGYCIPPYFLFQLRVDGHPSPV